MGAYGLPALHVNPPQQGPGPLEQYGQLAQLRAMMGQQQLQQQQIQGAQLENQMRQRQVQDQNAMTQAMQQWDGKDISQLPGLVLKHGGSANAVLGLKSSLLDYQTKLNGLTTAQLANEKQVNDMIAGHIDSIKQLPAEQQPAAFDAAKQDLAQKLPPQYQQQIAGIQYQGPQQLDVLEKMFMGHSAQVDQALKQSEMFKNQKQGEEAEAGTKLKNLQLQYGGTPEMQESRYNNTLAQLKSGKAVNPDDMAAAVAWEAAHSKTNTTSDSMGVMTSNTSKPSGLAAVLPKKAGSAAGGGSTENPKDSIVDLIGQYKADPSLLGRMLYRHPEVLGLLQQKYPDFDQTTYVAKNKLIQGYTSGPQSKEINAINTTGGHVAELYDAIDALGNGNVTLLNSIKNKLGIKVTGQTPAAVFKAIVHRVGPEITTAYVPGGGGEAERFANEADFSENLPPQTLKANAAETVKLLRSKIGALENQYKQTVGRDDFQQRFITPAAQNAFNRLAPQAGGGSNQSAPAAEVTATGPNGHKIVVRNGQWVDAQTGKPLQ